MKRLPIIRHIRYFWHAFRFNVWWAKEGQYLGAVPNERDIEYLAKVWRGEA